MCRCTPTILVVENRARTLLTNKRMFEAQGFRVITARNADEAKEKAAEQIIHLVLIDVRLKDDSKETDLSGLELTKYFHKHHPSIERVVTTAQKWERLQDLMLTVYEPDERAKALALFHKVERYRPKEVSQVVKSVFKSSIRLNSNLKITLNRGLSWEGMVNQLRQFASENGSDPARKERGIQMLKDLTCLLFSPKSSKDALASEVHFLSTSPGYSPCTVAMVRPKFNKASAARLAVKFGPQTSIDRESENYANYVRHFIPNSTRLEHETVLFSGIGGLVYTFVGDNVKSIDTLRKYYQDRSVANAQLCHTLDQLFSKTCEMWYTAGPNAADQKPTRLDILYREYLSLNHPSKVNKLADECQKLLQNRLSPLKSLKSDKIQMDLGDGTLLDLPNPLPLCLTSSTTQKRKTTKTPRGGRFFPIVSEFTITHGDLHAGNVIVNDGRTWLIDFYKTGPGHVLRDFAELESDIKFNLFEGDFRERYELETALLGSQRWTDPIILDNPTEPQTRALAAIKQVRMLAGKLTGVREMREYYGALLFYALKAIGGYTSGSAISHDQRLNQSHALLSAALICQQLIHAVSGKKGSVFLAHEYSSAFNESIHRELNRFLVKAKYQVLHPLDDMSGGQLWPRVQRMIQQAGAGFYEISTGNGNVYFELGYALGIQKPYFALIQKDRHEVKRPPLLAGELMQSYSSRADLKERVLKLLNGRANWKDSFFFMNPELREAMKKTREGKKSALLLVANTPRQVKEFAPLLEMYLADVYGWQVDVLNLETEVNIEGFLKRAGRAKLVVGCMASDRAVGSRYANAELALALGVCYGLQKKIVILQEKNYRVLTDLASVTTTFVGANGATKALKAKLQELFPHQTSNARDARRARGQSGSSKRSATRKKRSREH